MRDLFGDRAALLFIAGLVLLIFGLALLVAQAVKLTLPKEMGAVELTLKQKFGKYAQILLSMGVLLAGGILMYPVTAGVYQAKGMLPPIIMSGDEIVIPYGPEMPRTKWGRQFTLELHARDGQHEHPGWVKIYKWRADGANEWEKVLRWNPEHPDN